MPPILVPSATKRIATQILVIAKLNGRKDLDFRGCVMNDLYQQTTTCSKLATEAQD